MVRRGSQEVTATETEGQREKTLEDVTLLALKMEDGSMGKKKKTTTTTQVFSKSYEKQTSKILL